MILDELFEKRLLRRIPIDIKKSEKSLEVSDKFLKDTSMLLKAKAMNMAVLSAYTSMFHAARALLYKDGIQEKSHYAVYVYLKEKYSKDIGNELIFEFNNARDQRHEGLYGLDYEFAEEDIKHTINAAERFCKKIKEIINLQYKQ